MGQSLQRFRLRSPRVAVLEQDAHEVVSVIGMLKLLRPGKHRAGVDETHSVCHFFQASDLQALPLFNDANELGSIRQGLLSASIEPRNTSA